MTERYVCFQCPGCYSTFEVERKAVRTNVFLCPVCFEGEMEYQVPRKVKGELPQKAKILVA